MISEEERKRLLGNFLYALHYGSNKELEKAVNEISPIPFNEEEQSKSWVKGEIELSKLEKENGRNTTRFPKEQTIHTFNNVDEVKQALIDTLLGGKYSRKDNAGQHIIVKYNDTGCKFYWYTDKHEYSIVYINASAYLLGAFTNRYMRAGETWHRGNDLADGPANQKTLNSIIKDFISNELCTISPEVKNEIDINGINNSLDEPV